MVSHSDSTVFVAWTLRSDLRQRQRGRCARAWGWAILLLLTVGLAPSIEAADEGYYRTPEAEEKWRELPMPSIQAHAGLLETTTVVGRPNPKLVFRPGWTQASADQRYVTYREMSLVANDPMVTRNHQRLVRGRTVYGPVMDPATGEVIVLALTDEGWQARSSNTRVAIPNPRDEPVLRPDGQRFAFPVREQRQGVGWLDYVIEAEFVRRKIKLAPHPPVIQMTRTGLRYTGDSQVLLYPALMESGWTVIRNGKPGQFHEMVRQPIVAAHGPGWAYAAYAKQAWTVVSHRGQGPAAKRIQGGPTLSPDGNRLAWWAQQPDRQWALVVDHVLQPYTAHRPGPIVFSSDGQAYAFAGERDGVWAVTLVQGEQAITHAPVQRLGQNTLTFSADGKRLAYVAGHLGRWFTVVDGQPGAAHAQVAAGSLRFSPDGERFVYAGQNRAHWQVHEWPRPATNADRSSVQHKSPSPSEDGPRFVLIHPESIAFSADSRRLTYVGSHGGQDHLITEGDAPFSALQIRKPTFSADGRQCVAVGFDGSQWRLVIDGVATASGFEKWVPGAKPVFDDANRVRILGRRKPGPEFVLLEAAKPSLVPPDDREGPEPSYVPMPETLDAFEIAPEDQQPTDSPDSDDDGVIPGFVDVPVE